MQCNKIGFILVGYERLPIVVISLFSLNIGFATKSNINIWTAVSGTSFYREIEYLFDLYKI